MIRTLFACAAAAALLFPTLAAGQSPNLTAPDASKVRVRIGPLWMNPTLAVTDAGVDTNVFNDPARNDPKQDGWLLVDDATDEVVLKVYLRDGSNANFAALVARLLNENLRKAV